MADQKTRRTSFKCDECETTHSNEHDYNNHLSGKKHKRKVATKTAELRNNARKLLCETKGVFLGNLPPNAVETTILEYVSSFGKVEQWTYGIRFAKVLFADEQSAATFRRRKHVFGGHVLRLGAWLVGGASRGGAAGGRGTQEVAARALREVVEVEVEIRALVDALTSFDRSGAFGRLCSDLRADLQSVCECFSVHPFGSAVTGLAFPSSDVDVVVDNTFALREYEREGSAERLTSRVSPSSMQEVALALRRHFTSVVPIPGAKVPIIKCTHRYTRLNCDLSFSNISAVQNSRLISWYISCDPRVKPFLVVLKYWAFFFDLRKSCLTNYALVMMGLFYLQQLDDPIVPPAITLQTGLPGGLYVDGWNVAFETGRTFEATKNASSVLTLVIGFFEFYSRYDHGFLVVCPLLGKTLPKVLFGHTSRLPSELASCQLDPLEAEKRLSALKVDSPMCVQDPFLLDCNVTRLVTPAAALRIRAVCSSSVYVLREGSTVGLLKHLFQKRTADLALVPSLWNLKAGNHFEIELFVGGYTPALGPEATLEDARNVWYEKVSAAMTDIFESVFKFEVADESGAASGKYPRTMICKSDGPNLLTNRKLAGREIAVGATMSFLETQAGITERMMVARREAAFETAEFRCCLRAERDPTRVVVEFSDVASSKGAFGLWTKFFASHLADWVRNIVCDDQDATELDETELDEPTTGSA